MSPIFVAPTEASAQTIKLNAKTSSIHANMPFVLQVIVKDFDDNPQPEIDEFTISDATGSKTADVQFMGVSPQISSMTQIINGNITRKKDVTFIYSFRITPQEEGTYIIPEIHVHQGSKSVTSQKESFLAKDVSTTPDMRMELKMPDRQLWVGETFEMTLVWYLHREVGEYSFDIPVLTMPEQFEIEEPDQDVRGHNIVLATGSRQIAFPFTQDAVTLGGIQYDRFQIPIRVTPLKSGTISLKAARVSAQLVTGIQQDAWGFGFGSKQFEPYQAVDNPKTLTIVDLPQANRPASYSNAMGTNYSIEVRADRTIVKAGDPIILTIDITSSAPMGGLLLPSLTSAGLNEQLFGVSADTPVGENIDGGAGRYIRRFTVPVRIKSERVTEVPPIAFSYFNPKTKEYSTVRSQPIALSVSATTKIGSADVISGQTNADESTNSAAPSPNTANAEPSLPNHLLQLNLASTQESLNATNVNALGRYLRMGIYVFPFILWGIVAIVRRMRKSNEETAEQRTAAKALKEAIDKASSVEATTAAANISAALNTLITTTESPRQAFSPVLEKMEIAAYDPRNQKLSDEITKEIVETVKKNVNPKYLHIISSIFSLLFVIGVFVHADIAEAQTPVAANTESVQIDDLTLLNQATSSYHSAMSNTVRAERIAGFKNAYSMFNALAVRYPETAEFQVDAGNAALNAADFGHAVLSYKRALEIDPSLTQAQNNLEYIQNAQGDEHRVDARAISSVFFLNSVPANTRLLLAAILFALGILLIIPWSTKHKHLLRRIAILPLVAWLWLIIGVYSHTDESEAVVMHEAWLKTADNVGASNVQKTALVPGFSVKVLKTVPDWAQVETGSGVQGWIQETDIERVK